MSSDHPTLGSPRSGLDVGALEPMSSVVRFGRALRASGVVVSVDQLGAFATAFRWLNPLSMTDVYHAARATLLTRHADRAAFEQVFDSFFRGRTPSEPPAKMPQAPRHRPNAQRTALATLLSEQARRGDPEVSVRDRTDSASDTEQLGRKDFSRMSSRELEAVRRVLMGRRFPFATRRTRRSQPERRGRRVDARRLVARAARSGGALLELPRRQLIIKPRPVVVLADVSGSMELYARVLLHFFHGLRQRWSTLETFLFATRLTRVSEELDVHSVDRALSRVSESVVDFSSGTRIGDSLREFNRRWAPRMLRRGSVLIMVSDGWERGDAARLASEMQNARQRCYRLIWLNPRLGDGRYEPRVRGMRAALDHVDDFLPCHDLQSLAALGEHLSALPARRGLTPRGSAWWREQQRNPSHVTARGPEDEMP